MPDEVRFQPVRGGDWVTKSDITSYFRCPYAYWLLYTGKITFEQTLSRYSQQLIQEGVAFQEEIEARAEPITIEPSEFKKVDLRILNTPTMENAGLKIRGRPDGIDTKRGSMVPIEIKRHSVVGWLDQIELAFYWLLLEPYRNRRKVKPHGVIILNRYRHPEAVKGIKVPIIDERFEQVHDLIERVRRARREGVSPLVCRCRVCSVLMHEEVMAAVEARKHPSMIWGIGRAYSSALVAMGYDTYLDVLEADPTALAEQFREAGYRTVSENTILKWQLHAKSLKTSKPAMRKAHDPLGLGERFIAVDLEYGERVFLFGMCVANGTTRRHHSLWADSADQEGVALAKFIDICERHPELPIVTWGGNSADFPLLISAAVRHGVVERLAPLRDRHVDAYQWASRNYRAPISGLGIKQVGEYLGYERTTKGIDGADALALYNIYLRKRDESIKRKLVRYCREDVDSLIFVVEKLQESSTLKRRSGYSNRRDIL